MPPTETQPGESPLRGDACSAGKRQVKVPRFPGPRFSTMDPYQPPQAPAPPPEPSDARRAAQVPLYIGLAMLWVSVFVSVSWQIELIAFLFSLAGLLMARGKQQRRFGTFLSCINGGFCLFSLLFGESI